MRKLLILIVILPTCLFSQNYRITINPSTTLSSNFNMETDVNIGTDGFYFEDFFLGSQEIDIDAGGNKFWCLEARIIYDSWLNGNTPSGVDIEDIKNYIGQFFFQYQAGSWEGNNFNDFQFNSSGTQLSTSWKRVISGKKNTVFDVDYFLKNTYSTMPDVQEIKYKVEFQLFGDCQCTPD